MKKYMFDFFIPKIFKINTYLIKKVAEFIICYF